MTTSLQLVLDAAYPQIIDECTSVIRRVLPVSVGHYRRPAANAVRIYAYSPLWPMVFPQHGPGKKHERKIRLQGWQVEICDRHPRQLIRGLIHSDGSRCVNRFQTMLPRGRVATYEYPRYFFTNESPDIRAIFCRYCEKLGVSWTRSSSKNISIARRTSVALLDEFVGPKR